MRIARVLATIALVVPLVAVAADKTKPAVIEKLIASNLKALAKLEPDAKLELAKDATVVIPGGVVMDPDMGISSTSTAYYAGNGGRITHKPGKTTLAIDDAKGIAYFQTPFDISMRWVDESGGGGGQSYKTVERIGGIAVRDGTAWKLAAVMYTKGVDSDAKVIDHASNARPPEEHKGPPAKKGDDKLATIVEGWFKGGLATGSVKTGKRIASGTGPKEFGVDAGALKLAKAWDKLGLQATKIEVTQVAGGAAAFAQVECNWFAKQGKEKITVPLLAGIVMVPEGTDWKWVSIQFTPL